MNTYPQDLIDNINAKFLRKNGTLTTISKTRYFKFWNNNINIINDIKKYTAFLGDSDDNFKERIYCIFNNITEIPLCEVCGNKSKYTYNMYQRTCSMACGVYIKPKSNKKLESYTRLYNIVGTKLKTTQDNYINRVSDIYINCISCNTDYSTTAAKEFNANTPGLCNKCRSSTTQPIVELCTYMDSIGVRYTLEKRFKDCINPTTRYVLPFDIYLDELNILVEYDGIHHFVDDVYSKGSNSLYGQQYRDNIKSVYALNNNIQLIRIPYTQNNVVATLKQHLNTMISPVFEVYTWSEFDKDINDISNYISSFKYDSVEIYGVYRGGLIPAIKLANITPNSCKNIGIIQFQSYDGNDKTATVQFHSSNNRKANIFVIDDIYDSGNTIAKIKSMFGKARYKHCNIHYVTLYGRVNNHEVHYVRTNTTYVTFPWE